MFKFRLSGGLEAMREEATRGPGEPWMWLMDWVLSPYTTSCMAMCLPLFSPYFQLWVPLIIEHAAISGPKTSWSSTRTSVGFDLTPFCAFLSSCLEQTQLMSVPSVTWRTLLSFGSLSDVLFLLKMIPESVT